MSKFEGFSSGRRPVTFVAVLFFLGLWSVRGLSVDGFPGLTETCPQVLEFVSEYEMFTSARRQAALAHPRSPLARGHELRARVAVKDAAIAERLLAYDKAGKVAYKGQQYPKLVAEDVEDLNSVRIRPAVPPKARVMIPLLHGTGATWSHSGAMLQAWSS